MEDNFKETLISAWSQSSHSGNVHNRLDECATILRKWANNSVGSLPRNILRVRKRIEVLKERRNSSTYDEELNNLEISLEKLLSKEELYWRQRSRINWLKSEDRNTTFFHKSTSARRKRNGIRLYNSDNLFVTNQREMEYHVTRFFGNLFASQLPERRDIRQVNNLIPNKLSNAACEILSHPFTNEEVFKALMDLNPSKAPGPDGFTALFFQNAWDTMEEDISKEVLRVLNEGESLDSWNSTVVTLIPKSKDSTHLKDFRPISLCNVKYKIVAHTITNRLKKVMNDLVDPQQSAFIPGRVITDNVILGFECMHWLRSTTVETL